MVYLNFTTRTTSISFFFCHAYTECSSRISEIKIILINTFNATGHLKDVHNIIGQRSKVSSLNKKMEYEVNQNTSCALFKRNPKKKLTL